MDVIIRAQELPDGTVKIWRNNSSRIVSVNQSDARRKQLEEIYERVEAADARIRSAPFPVAEGLSLPFGYSARAAELGKQARNFQRVKGGEEVCQPQSAA